MQKQINIWEEYRFGFNGMEKDPEITGQEGSHYTAKFWEYDTRIGRRWNVDPVDKPWESSYLAFSGNPIIFNDPNGDNATKYVDKEGKLILDTKDGSEMVVVITDTRSEEYNQFVSNAYQADDINSQEWNYEQKSLFLGVDWDDKKEQAVTRYGARLTSKSATGRGLNVPAGRSLYSINTDDLPKAGRGRQSIRTPKQFYDASQKVRDFLNRFRGGLKNMESEEVEKGVETKNEEIHTPIQKKPTEVVLPIVTYDTIWLIVPFTGFDAERGKDVQKGDTSGYTVIERHNGNKARTKTVYYD